MKILSWNVNGIRAAAKKGLYDFIKKESPDIICFQEIKATSQQLPPYLRNSPGYHVFINPAEKGGYSGVATFSKEEPKEIRKVFNIKKFDVEGRIFITEYPSFTLFNIYFPNGKKDKERLEYKMNFYDAFLNEVDNLKTKGKNIIACGDFNTAHKEIDIARPKENEKISGFLSIERAWIDKFIEHGYVDTFRYFNKQPNQYTWWDMKTRARERNVGWRIDYFFTNKEFMPHVKKAFIMQDVMGSDHCPTGLIIDL